MSKVITFSRFFPAHHSRKGEPTYFVEKIWSGIKEDFSKTLFGLDAELLNFAMNKYEPKHHTIRSGKRWKVGDKFSPRVWSGKPYCSKQITIGPDIEIKQTWDIDIRIEGGVFINNKSKLSLLPEIAKNDGLSIQDFLNWFKYPKVEVENYQIISWNDQIEY